MNRFYKGQKIVALKNGASFKKGDVFIVVDVIKGCCNWNVDIGIRTGQHTICSVCDGIIKSDDIWWFLQSIFAPIEEIPESHEQAIKELIEESIEKVVSL